MARKRYAIRSKWIMKRNVEIAEGRAGGRNYRGNCVRDRDETRRVDFFSFVYLSHELLVENLDRIFFACIRHFNRIWLLFSLTNNFIMPVFYLEYKSTEMLWY